MRLMGCARPPVAVLVVMLLSRAGLADHSDVPAWIWSHRDQSEHRTAYLRKTFEMGRAARAAQLAVVGDCCRGGVYVNGKSVAWLEGYGPMVEVDVSAHVQTGTNVVAVEAAGDGGPAAVAIELALVREDGTRHVMRTDRSWRVAARPSVHWKEPLFIDEGWGTAVEFGSVDEPPWGDPSAGVAIGELDDYTQWKRAIGSTSATSPASFQLPAGFEIELVRSAGSDEGSWISLAFDPKGRLVIAKEKKGLLRLTIPETSEGPAGVETIDDTLEECRGLLFAFDSLYANANNSKGLFRLRDTNGDDRFDSITLLKATGGKGGHGRNDLALGPDGMIYVVHGDAVEMRADSLQRTPPVVERFEGEQGWNGHIVRTDPDGKVWEVVAAGLRNPFGIDFDAAGEMFTYDADAEHDMGAPWYRPTRVRHLVSGADFGWRQVTGIWPPYYPDAAEQPPSTLDVGKGSPTAVKFGTRSAFPPRYRRALFILDWAYGRIIAVHMAARGASYTCRAETFLRGRPANVTDLDFGPDGAMYFVTGGRGTQSGLYRVRYIGPEIPEPVPTPQQQARQAHAAKARAQRRRLETLHSPGTQTAIDEAWPHLGSPDPWIRHAARVAIEHQPYQHWQERALAESAPLACLTALVALARVLPESIAKTIAQSRILNRLDAVPLAELPTPEKLLALRIHELCLTPDGLPPDAVKLPQTLHGWLPDESPAVNRELTALLVRWGERYVPEKAIPLLASAKTQEDKLHYLLVLRAVPFGWTPALRKVYFEALLEAQGFQGGAGMPNFLQRIRADALAAVPEPERDQWAALLDQGGQEIDGPPAGGARPFVRQWKLADLDASLAEAGPDRDTNRGREMFRVAACVRCHRLGGDGRTVGPDLADVSRRFGRRDLLEAILDPSKIVAEPYRKLMLVTSDGDVVVGQVVLHDDYRSPELWIAADPLQTNRITKVAKDRIESHRALAESPMPTGLLDTLTRKEILDLIAYIESGGHATQPPASTNGAD